MKFFKASGVVVLQKPVWPTTPAFFSRWSQKVIEADRVIIDEEKCGVMENVQIKKSVGGRPLQAIKKEYKISVRFSRQEYFILKEKAKEAGIKPSAFIRQAVIKTKIVSRISAEEMKHYRELSGMSSNINQVARIANREGLFASMQYFHQCRERFDHALQKLKP